jgi:hypothetical protein
MTDAKFNDLSKDASEVIRYDRAYKVTVFSYGNKVTMDFDTKLDQPCGTLKEMVQIARQNGIAWELVEWITDKDTGKRKQVRQQATLDVIPKELNIQK